MDGSVDYYRIEYKKALKRGDFEYAKSMKKKYRLLVMKTLERPHLQFIDELKAFGAICLN